MSPADFDALVFDLDGTLWDAASASTYGWNLALEKLGSATRVTDEGIRSVSGRPFEQCVAALLPEFTPADRATLELIDGYERVGIETVGGQLYPGVADGLRALAAKYHLYLVSNCPDWYLEAFFRISGLRDLFSGSDCHGTSGLGKADMLTRLAARHGLRKALYVGDTQSDRDAAEGAGMHFAFVSYGFGSTVDPALAFAGFPELTAALLA